MIKETVNSVIKQMQERPEDFLCTNIGRSRWKDIRTGIIYRAEFGVFTGIEHPYQLSFGPIFGFRFRAAIKSLMCWKTINKNGGELPDEE